jgi:putative ABC transport system permease protein
MFRNYLAAALRNLARNKLYAGVTILGLAIGFAAAMLIGLYVRDELTYDRFVPGHDRVFQVTETLEIPGSKPIETSVTPMMLARPLKADFPEVEEVARLSPSYFPPGVRRGDFVATEMNVYWGDPSFFRVMPLPALAGDLATALEAPDGVVITRAMARKYFGKDAPLGGVLRIDGQPMRVTAVLKDLPSNTHLNADFIASTRAARGPIALYEAINGPVTNTLATYIRLRPGASPATMAPRFPQFLATRLPLTDIADGGGMKRQLHLVPLTRIHLTPTPRGAVKAPADPAVIAAIGLVGVLIVLVAAINFVTLMTARGARRAVEVGVRKASGASRRNLIVQFLGEALIYVFAAAVLAVSLAELLLPAMNVLLQRKLVFDYLNDAGLAGAIVTVVLATGLLAGVYPALVLSSFRPAAVLKGGPIQG